MVAENVTSGGHGDVRVESVGQALFLHGTVEDPAHRTRLVEGVQAVAAGPVIDALRLGAPPQVRIEVLISEVSRTVTKELGIDWSLDSNPLATLTNPLQTVLHEHGVRIGSGALSVAAQGYSVQTYPNGPDEDPVDVSINDIGVQNPPRFGGAGGLAMAHRAPFNSGKFRLTTFVDALAQNGLVTVHARPNLTTLSGQPAEFFSGLEVPVPAITDRGIVGTQYMKTGVGLIFTPQVQSREQISLTVEADVREVAVGGAVIAGAAVPNINERSASTTVELADGESIAIAGLYRNSVSTSDAGIPVLRDIPLWGTLFGNRSTQDRSAELIIIVTPRIVRGVPAAPPGPPPGVAAASARRLDNQFHY